jgi:pimeloyl-CoA synthetase
MEAGNIPELDAIVRASTSLLDPSLHTQLQAAVAQLPPHDDSVYRYPDMSGMYIRTAERVRERVSKGVSAEQWVTSEVQRLQEALLQEDVQADERDDLHLALNVSECVSVCACACARVCACACVCV